MHFPLPPPCLAGKSFQKSCRQQNAPKHSIIKTVDAIIKASHYILLTYCLRSLQFRLQRTSAYECWSWCAVLSLSLGLSCSSSLARTLSLSLSLALSASRSVSLSHARALCLSLSLPLSLSLCLPLPLSLSLCTRGMHTRTLVCPCAQVQRRHTYA